MKRRHQPTIAVAVVALLSTALVACQPLTASGTEELQGKVIAMQDLYTLEKEPFNGFYQQLRQVSIDDQLVYIPLTGDASIEEAKHLELSQLVKVEVDHNRMVKQLSIESGVNLP